MTAKNRKPLPRTDAMTAYRRERAKVTQLLGLITVALRESDASAAATPNYYTHSGSMTHVRTQLVETLAFMTESDTEQILAMLK